MRSRALRIAILLFQALWLNVIVPGHQRGVVRLPGEDCPECREVATAQPACCEDEPREKHPAKPQRDPALHCAICYFAARLSPAPFVDLTPPPLRLTNWRPLTLCPIRTSRPCLATCDERGPPALV